MRAEIPAWKVDPCTEGIARISGCGSRPSSFTFESGKRCRIYVPYPILLISPSLGRSIPAASCWATTLSTAARIVASKAA